MDKKRCGGVGEDQIYLDYHDYVWGRPVYDCQELFAKLCLDGQQAGLSWITILKKQKTYEAAYANFDPEVIAKFDDAKVEDLLQDKGIVRNRLKVNSIIKNARAYMANFSDTKGEQGDNFSAFLWSFVGGSPIVNHFNTMEEIPVQTPESEAMSKALKKMGFNFVGPTICYAFMQAVGMFNDHATYCFCYDKCNKEGPSS